MVETIDHKKFKIVIKDQSGEVLLEKEMDEFQTQTDYVVYPKPYKVSSWQLMQGNADTAQLAKIETINQQIITVTLKEPPMIPKIPKNPEGLVSRTQSPTTQLETDDGKLKVADILEKAADILLRDGWTQGKYHKQKKEVKNGNG